MGVAGQHMLRPAPTEKCHNCHAPRCSLTTEYTLLWVHHSVFRAANGAAQRQAAREVMNQAV